MKIGINPSDSNQNYEVVLEREEGKPKTMGSLSDSLDEETWQATGSILRCIELLTSNKEWKEGNL